MRCHRSGNVGDRRVTSGNGVRVPFPSVTRNPYPVTRNDGAILLTVLIVILTIALLGATLMALFFTVLSLGQTELDRARALYLAEAGVAQAVHMLKSQTGLAPSVESQQIIPPTPLGEGFFEVYNDFSQSTITSIGVSHSVKRTIQVKYSAF